MATVNVARGVCLFLIFAVISRSTADTKACDDLSHEVRILQQQGRDQAEMLKKQGEILQQLQSMVEIQNIQIKDQQTKIGDYSRRLQQLELVTADLPNQRDPYIEDDTVELASSKEAGNDISSYQDDQPTRQIVNRRATGNVKHTRALLGGETPIAFHAVVKAYNVDHMGVNQKLVFPDVLVNLGAGYHNQHGLFIAPQPGLYLFSTSIMSKQTDHVEIYVHIMKNGNVLANAYAHGDSGRHDQGSVTVVTQLAVGDEVWVSLFGPADTSLWGNSFDSFMGCLLFPV